MPGLSVLVLDGEQRITAVAGAVPVEGTVLVGRPVGDAFAPDARAAVLPAVAEALAGTATTVLLPDDDQGGLEVRCRPVGGGHPGAVCLVQDLAAQADTSLLLEATRAFEITFRHSPIGQGLLSRSGRWLRVNGALSELVGRSADDLVGAEMGETLHPEDRDAERERLRRLVDGPDDHHVVRARFLRADGRAVHTHTRMTRITDDGGTVRGFVAQVVDAAAWKRFSGR